MTSMDQYTSLAHSARRALEQTTAVATKSAKIVTDQVEWWSRRSRSLVALGERSVGFVEDMADVARRYAEAVGSALR